MRNGTSNGETHIIDYFVGEGGYLVYECPLCVWETSFLKAGKDPLLVLLTAQVWACDWGGFCWMLHPRLWTESQRHEEAGEAPFGGGGNSSTNMQLSVYRGGGGPHWTRSKLLWALWVQCSWRVHGLLCMPWKPFLFCWSQPLFLLLTKWGFQWRDTRAPPPPAPRHARYPVVWSSSDLQNQPWGLVAATWSVYRGLLL